MELMELKAIVNFAKPYRVAEGGTTNQGITINYLVTDTLKPYEDMASGSQGYKSTKSSLDLGLAEKLTHVPGYYNLKCEIGVASTGQPVLKPVDIEFLSFVDIKFSDTVEGLESAKTNVTKVSKDEKGDVKK